jgi:hypothetical protein
MDKLLRVCIMHRVAAVSTIMKIEDLTASPAARLRAADLVLSHTTKAIEIEDIRARVAKL